jgi:hypothetical protein
MAKKDNTWVIISGIIFFISIVVILYYSYYIINRPKKINTKQKEYEYEYEYDDETNIKQDNTKITDDNPFEFQKENVIDIDKTLIKYLNFEITDNLYERFDTINDTIPNKVLVELYNDLLLTIPQTLKNKLICQSQITNKLLIKQNVLCILSQFFYWWIEENNIPENNSVIEKNMLLILLILFLINDDKINIKDIMKYNSNNKTMEFVSSNLKKLLENVLNVNINKYVNKYFKLETIKQYQKEFLTKNEQYQKDIIDKIKKNVNNSNTKLQKYPKIRIKSADILISNINYLNSNLNDKLSFDELTNKLFSMNIEIIKIYNKLNLFSRSINNNNIFTNNDAVEFRNKIKIILDQLKNIHNKSIEVINKAKILEIKKSYDISKNIICTQEYKPVCGVNNITYNNLCKAGNIKILYNRACDKIIDNVYQNTIISNSQNLPITKEPITDCSSNIDYVCGVNNITYNNTCKAEKINIKVLHKGKCNTIEEDSNNKSKAISSFKESLNDSKDIITQINIIQKQIFNIIKKYNEINDKEEKLFDSNIILPDTISISYLIKILKKLFILSRSNVNTYCNCIYDEKYDFNFVHADYITNYLI